MAKVISFFSEKGGVGKTVHSVLFADYLAYHCGEKVVVIDMESPKPRIQLMREHDDKLLADEKSVLSQYVSKLPQQYEPYEIVNLGNDMEDYTVETSRMFANRVIDVLRKTDEGTYVVLDFPGLFIEHCPAFYILARGIANLVMVPTDVDMQSRRSATRVASCLCENGANCMVFWNNVPKADIDRKGYLEVGEEVYTSRGIPVHPTRIKSFVKAKKEAEDRLFVRNTVCWPQRYVELACPELPLFYADLKKRLDNIGG